MDSEVEKAYIGMVLELAEDSLSRAAEDMFGLFPDIPRDDGDDCPEDDSTLAI